jgi:hypothetical protein
MIVAGRCQLAVALLFFNASAWPVPCGIVGVGARGPGAFAGGAVAGGWWLMGTGDPDASRTQAGDWAGWAGASTLFAGTGRICYREAAGPVDTVAWRTSGWRNRQTR